MSGPSRRLELGAMTPRFTVPATTVPTPGRRGEVPRGESYARLHAMGRDAARGDQTCAADPPQLRPSLPQRHPKQAPSAKPPEQSPSQPHPPTWHAKHLVDDELGVVARVLKPGPGGGGGGRLLGEEVRARPVSGGAGRALRQRGVPPRRPQTMQL